jgi:P27 family predicted phage terminase small subunit
MGRPRKPTALKELEGNPGKKALPKNEPRPDPGMPEMPKGLSRDAKEEWRRVGPTLNRLGLFSHIDRTNFTEYCELVSDVKALRKIIKKEGRVYWVGGFIKRNPAVSELNRCLGLLRQYLIEFGMTPASRARVAAQMVDDPRQPRLPGTETPSTDPEKPHMPNGPFADDEFFGNQTAPHQRH